MSSASRPLPEWKRFRFPQSLYKYGALLGSLAFVWWTLEVLRNTKGKWLLLGTYQEDDEVRAEPFDAVPLMLGALWTNLNVAAKRKPRRKR